MVQHVTVSGDRDLAAAVLRLGPAPDAAMKWRFGPLLLRAELASVRRADAARRVRQEGLPRVVL